MILEVDYHIFLLQFVVVASFYIFISANVIYINDLAIAGAEKNMIKPSKRILKTKEFSVVGISINALSICQVLK